MRQIWTRIEDFDTTDEVIKWHLQHGWVYLGRDEAERPVALLYLTIICGHGVVLHYSDLGIKVSIHFYREALRQALAFLRRDAGVIYATIPKKLVRIQKLVRHLGFVAIDRFGEYIFFRDTLSGE